MKFGYENLAHVLFLLSFVRVSIEIISKYLNGFQTFLRNRAVQSQILFTYFLILFIIITIQGWPEKSSGWKKPW